MFIRRTKTRSAEGGKVYYSYRLVRSERSGERVRQRTLLNLGSEFAVATEHWAVLCSRIEQLLERQGVLVELDCPEEVEREAQRIAMQLVQRGAEVAAGGTDLQTVDVESLELERPRTVGVEHVGLWAMERLGLGRLLEGLGFNGRQRAVAVGSIIGRMGQPGSERASWRWLCERSGLGELLEVDFEAMSLMRLYRVSDALMAHREAIEKHLFEQVTELFGLGHTVTLYDLTNTFFEGEAADQPKAQRGHSKEKRSDCALLTLGLVLDGSGFVRRSEVFAGRVDEDKTLEPMLKALHAPADALVVMDAGIATEDNVAWLRDNGYRYLVVSRQRTRRFDPERSIAIETRSHHKVHLHKVVDEDRGEVRLYCYSEERAKKEEGIARRFAERFESELRKLHEGLSRPRTRKGLDSVWQRIGRIQERCRGAGQHYTVDVVADPHSAKAVALTWKRQAPCRHHAHPSGCLLSTLQCPRLGSTDLVAHLHHAHRSRSRVPLSQVRTRPPPHLPQNPEPFRRSPLHHRHRLPTGPDHPQAPRRTRRERQLDHSASYPPRPAPGHRLLPPKGRPNPPRPQGHPCRATPTQNLHRSRSPPRTRWGHQIDRLNTLTVEM